jgi:hypothetical protein
VPIEEEEEKEEEDVKNGATGIFTQVMYMGFCLENINA